MSVGDNTVSVARFETEFRRSLRHALTFWQPDAVECMGSYAVIANGLSNSVPVAIADRAIELISRIEGRARAKWRGPAATPDSDSILMVPLESHCVFIGKRALVSIATPCGKREFSVLRQRWTKQTSELAAIFRAEIEWEWQSPVNPSRLEQLVEALLSEEAGLQWCRATGPSFDRDQGRDLVASWLTPPGLNQTLTQEQSETPAVPPQDNRSSEDPQRLCGKIRCEGCPRHAGPPWRGWYSSRCRPNLVERPVQLLRDAGS